MTGDNHTELAVEVYTRPALLLEPVDAKIETLQAMEGDTVDDLAVHSWPGEVSVSDHDMYEDVEQTFRAFEAWAEANDVSIRPPFSIRTRRSRITGETATVLVTPVMSLAIYLDDSLAGVYPHSDADVHHPVSEAISALRTGDLPARQTVSATRPMDAEQVATVADGCRGCGGVLVNVQGLLTCHDCLETVRIDRSESVSRRARLSPGVD